MWSSAAPESPDTKRFEGGEGSVEQAREAHEGIPWPVCVYVTFARESQIADVARESTRGVKSSDKIAHGSQRAEANGVEEPELGSGSPGSADEGALVECKVRLWVELI